MRAQLLEAAGDKPHALTKPHAEPLLVLHSDLCLRGRVQGGVQAVWGPRCRVSHRQWSGLWAQGWAVQAVWGA